MNLVDVSEHKWLSLFCSLFQANLSLFAVRFVQIFRALLLI